MTLVNREARDNARLQGFYFTQASVLEDPTPRFWNATTKLWFSWGSEQAIKSDRMLKVYERKITYVDTLSLEWENLYTFEIAARAVQEDLDGVWEILHSFNPHFDPATMLATQALKELTQWMRSQLPPSQWSMFVEHSTAPSGPSEPTPPAPQSSETPQIS